MTAKGKITTANLIENETRILVADMNMIDGTTELRPATKQSGARVARVLEVRAGTRQEFETIAPREVVTTEGVIRAYGHAAWILAPESKPAIKAAEIAAYEEDAARTPAVETVEAEYTEDDIRHIEAAIANASGIALDIMEKAITDARECGKLNAENFERLNRRYLNRIAEQETPEPGDLMQRYSDGNVYEVTEVTASAIYMRASLGFGRGVHTRDIVFREYRVFARNAWRERIARCANDWHGSAPIRSIRLCPECPA